MAIVGEAYVVVKAITTGFSQQVQQSLNGLNQTGSQAGQNVGKAFSNGAAGGLSKADQEAKKVYDSVNRLIEGSYYLQSGLTAAAGAISVLVGGLFALGSQIAAATPALIVLPSIFMAIGQAALTAKLAFGGIGKAIGGLTKPKPGGTPIGKMPGLLREYASAEERVGVASKRVEKETKALDQARIDAAENLQQLKFSSEDAAIGEKKAALELEKARKTLARVQDLPPNSTARKEAELAYAEADLNYRKAKDNNSDLKKEVDKRNAAGIEGSKEVIAAQEQLDNANRESKHAIDAQALALEKLNHEKENPSGPNPLAGLTPEAAQFAKYIAGLKPKLDELRSAVGKTLFPPLEIAVDNLVKNLFPSLKTILADTGTALGKTAVDLSKIITSSDNLKNLNTVAGTNKDTIGKLGKVTGNLYSVFLSLMSAADPLVRRFTDWVTALTDSWKASVEAKNKTGELTKVFNDAGDVAAQLGRIFKNIGIAIFNMGKAASGPGSGGQMIFDFLEKATAKFKTFSETGLKDGSLEAYFKSVADSFNKVLHVLGVVSGAILKTGDDKGTESLFTSLSHAAEIFAGALGTLSEGGAGGAFGKFIEQVAKFFAATSESGSLKIYFGIMTTALGLLNKILSNPIGAKILGIAAAAHGGRTAFRRLGESADMVRKYIVGDKNSMLSAFKSGKAGLQVFTDGFKYAKQGGATFGQALQAGLANKFPKLVGGLKNAASAVKNFDLKGRLAAVGTKIWTGIQAAFNAVMDANPIALTVIAIVALIAIVVVMYMKFKWFRDFVATVWDGIKAAIEGVFNWLKDNWKLILVIITGPFGLAVALIVKYWDDIKAAIAFVWDNVIKPIFEGMFAVFKLAWDGIKAAFNFVWDVIKAAIELYWNFYIKPIFELMLTVFKLAWDGIKAAFTIVWDVIKTAIDFAWNKIIKPIFEAFGTIFGKVWDGIKTAFTGAWDFITKAIDGAKSIFGKIGDAIILAFKTAINFIIRGWNAIEFKIPGFKLGPIKFDGFTLGLPDIPELAEGGVINPTRGGTLARIGEAGKSERIEPLDSEGLSKRDRAIITMLSGGQATGGINITVNPSPGMDEVELAALVSRQISFQLRRGAA